MQGALVYATAVPFNQLSIPSEKQTNSSGWAELDFRMLAGFPVSWQAAADRDLHPGAQVR